MREEESTIVTGPTSTIRGVKWCIRLRRSDRGGILSSALATVDERLAHCRCVFKSHIVNGPLNGAAVSDTFTFRESHFCSFYVGLAGWHVLGAGNAAVVDGIITVEMEVEPGDPQFLPDNRVRKTPHALNFDQLLFTDMVVGVEGEEETIACNKEVVARHSMVCSNSASTLSSLNSKVIFVAMTTESTKEYQSGRFVIGHPCGTIVNVRLMIKGMYGDLTESELKEHSADLLRLAHMYESERVSEMAVDALKRHLTADTFWRTIEVAVELDNKELIEICAQFANHPADKFMALAKRTDGRAMLEDKEKHVVNGLWLAMSK